MTDEESVLGNLPRSRPGQRSEKRDRPRPAAGGRRAAGAATGEKADGAGARSDGDPVGDAIRATARLAGTGARVAGAVAQEVLRRIPRP
jgi:hypothetical protein